MKFIESVHKNEAASTIWDLKYNKYFISKFSYEDSIDIKF